MGTHISRVKSVDLDAWTDEQAQSMVKWGNRKANKYWEAKLDANHIPAEGKIDNFVKTKYVSKRWTDQETRPDPDDLSDEEVHSIPHVNETTTKSIPSSNTRRGLADDAKPSIKNADSHLQEPADSLLGLDLLSPSQNIRASEWTQASAPITTADQTPRSNVSLLSSATELPNPKIAVGPRNDLKMSIMSLYASAPKPQQTYNQRQVPTQAHLQPGRSVSDNGSSAISKPASAFDDLNGLFGGLNVAAAVQPPRSHLSVNSSQPPKKSGLQQPSAAGAPSGPGTSRPPDTFHSDAREAEDAWGGFQGTQATNAPKSSTAFDDLYSTSVS